MISKCRGIVYSRVIGELWLLHAVAGLEARSDLLQADALVGRLTCRHTSHKSVSRLGLVAKELGW